MKATPPVAEWIAITAPGSHWAKPAQAAARVNRLRIRDDVALILLTEVTPAQYAAIKGTDGWDQAKVGEIVFTWRTDTLAARWRVLTAILTLIVFFTGRGGRKEGVRAAVLRLTDLATGQKGVARGFHSPSSVQDGLQWSDKAPRVAAAQEALAKTGRRVRRTRRRHPAWFQIVMADFNLDMFRPRWVAYLEGTLNLDCSWVGHMPDHGSHGSRLIAGAFVTGADVVDAFLAGGDPSHDHLATAARLRLTARKEKHR